MTDKAPGKLVEDSWAAKNESLHSCPSSCDDHKKPTVMPVGDKANQAVKHA